MGEQGALRGMGPAEQSDPPTREATAGHAWGNGEDACSYMMNTRDALRAYFKRSHEALKDDGVFFCDMFGGPEAQEETKEKTKHKKHGFSYIWHQAEFHPVTNFIRCHIHFHFKDGSKIKKAFTYEWRLWSAPELRELLLEAGFSKATVYWEGEDEDGDGNGEFTPDEKGEADLAWIAYIVAEK